MRLTVSSSPHIHREKTITSIMLDVIIALIPSVIAGIYFFGYRAALVIATAVAGCILSEFAYEKITKKPTTVRDLSAVVTGLLLALNLPSTIPLWMVLVGSIFAIVIVKQLYGGLGCNFVNPALAARCFMLIAWASAMTNFVTPFSGIDAVSSATPLAVLKGTSEGMIPTLKQAFLGEVGGCIGETSTLMLLLGAAYLFFKRIIDWKIPVCYIGLFAVLTYLFGTNNTSLSQGYFTLLHICSGGLILGAFFMATDYVTTPTSGWGQVIFGLGCGLLTFAIRKFGGYPEGVSFSILLMNLTTPLIDRYIVPRKFGEVSKSE